MVARVIAYTRELINSPKAGLGFSFSSLINFEFLSKFIEYMYSPKVAITNRASVFFDLPNERSISVHIAGKINRLTIGMNSKINHHQGLFINFSKINPLYIGMKLYKGL